MREAIVMEEDLCVPWRQIFQTFGEIGDDVSSDTLSESADARRRN
jgi:hypothetical protein